MLIFTIDVPSNRQCWLSYSKLNFALWSGIDVFGIGTLSPVNVASFTMTSPEMTAQSQFIYYPSCKTIKSPGKSSEPFTVLIVSSFRSTF